MWVGRGLLAERPKDEFALEHGFVWDREVRGVPGLVFVKYYIEIDVPRTFVDGLLPAHFVLDTFHLG